MCAAFGSLGQALIDAVAVGLIGDDENAAVGMRGRGNEQKRADQECIENEC
jgi:hypothetical protein